MRGKPGLLTFFIAVVLANTLGAQEVVIELPADTDSIEGFIAFRDSVAESPEGGAAVFVLAMLLLTENEELGRDAMTVALGIRSQLAQDQDGYRGFAPGRSAEEFINRHLLQKPYIARSYLLGTLPEEAYDASPPYRVSLTQNRYSEIADDRVKVFVACSGAASPRPITLQRNNRGIWKAYEYSSLFVGVAPPPQQIDDAL